jgi:ubiquinone biosynthesis protein
MPPPMLIEALWPDGRRLKPREVVAEFAKHLARRARPDARGRQLLAAAAQLPAFAAARGARGALGLVLGEVMVMERMHGTPIGRSRR